MKRSGHFFSVLLMSLSERTLILGCLLLLLPLTLSSQDFDFTADKTIICEGEEVTFSLSVEEIQDGTTFKWDFGSGALPPSGDGPGPHTVRYGSSGQYTVTLVIIEEGEESETVTKENFITVIPPTAVGGASEMPVLCINTALIPITHTTIGATGIGLPDGLPAGVIAEWVDGEIFISGTPEVAGIFSYIIPLTGGCREASAIGTITVNDNVTPLFDAVGPYCEGADIPALPTESTNGITGTWSPVLNNIATTTYIFIPDAGQCATTATLEIVITENATPLFDAVGPYCEGAEIPALPLISTNEITGTWSPALNNSATTTYTFTPDPGQCATTTTLEIVITENVTPLFDAVGPYCEGAEIPALPLISTNEITGTWSPALNNSATTTYTFTPDPGQCATATTLTITVNPMPVTSAITGDATPACGGEGYTYSVTSTPGSTYQWTVPEGSIIVSGQETNSITVNFGTANGNITVTETNTSGCTGESVTLAISLLGCDLEADFESDIQSVCIGSEVIFTDLSTGISEGTTYAWDFGVGATPATATGVGPHTVVYGIDGEKTVSLTITDGASATETKENYITVSPLNTVTAASSTPTLCINTILPAITHTTTGATGIGTATGLPVGVTANWSDNIITISGTPTESGTFNYTIPLTGGCGEVSATGTITVSSSSGPAGPINGPITFTPGTTDITYSIESISNATGYVWDYSGTGVIINGNSTNTVTLDFSESATAGTLTVYGTNDCGDGQAATLNLSSSTKTLTLTSVLLEGLYIGNGMMRQASGDSGPHWPSGIADHITVELHNPSSYATIEHRVTGVELATNGTAILTVPAEFSGLYYITIKHRNHLETTTFTPISFTNDDIDFAFDSVSKAYGDNLKIVDGSMNDCLIYGGDSNNDGVTDGQDLVDIENGATLFSTGYLSLDLNGDGIVDALDLILVERNVLNFVIVVLP